LSVTTVCTLFAKVPNALAKVHPLHAEVEILVSLAQPLFIFAQFLRREVVASSSDFPRSESAVASPMSMVRHPDAVSALPIL
jgi:hypothetical protein